MRMSCNGCRVLRKGCSDSCTIRPCLQWIKNPDSQSNATVFLAKFYGRAGLMNLINAGPDHLRPAVFRSLLYEACGRIVNPVYGSIGLLWSGSWHLCQAAVEAVLRGEPIMQLPAEPAAAPQMRAACDIRHVPREENPGLEGLHKPKSRTRFKRSTRKPKVEPSGTNNSSSRGSSLSRETDRDSMLSVETSLRDDEPAELELELTLGFHASRATASEGTDGLKWDTCKEEMAMDVTA